MCRKTQKHQHIRYTAYGQDITARQAVTWKYNRNNNNYYIICYNYFRQRTKKLRKKLSQKQAAEDYRVVRSRGSHKLHNMHSYNLYPPSLQLGRYVWQKEKRVQNSGRKTSSVERHSATIPRHFQWFRLSRGANDSIIGVRGMDRKGRGEKRPYLNSRNSPLIGSEAVRTMTKISSQERCSPGRDLKPRPRL
jgi:hypothetical protein